MKLTPEEMAARAKDPKRIAKAKRLAAQKQKEAEGLEALNKKKDEARAKHTEN